MCSLMTNKINFLNKTFITLLTFKRLSLMYVFWWNVSLLLITKVLSQGSHLNGFSPSCVIWWHTRLLLQETFTSLDTAFSLNFTCMCHEVDWWPSFSMSLGRIYEAIYNRIWVLVKITAILWFLSLWIAMWQLRLWEHVNALSQQRHRNSFSCVLHWELIFSKTQKRKFNTLCHNSVTDVGAILFIFMWPSGFNHVWKSLHRKCTCMVFHFYGV